MDTKLARYWSTSEYRSSDLRTMARKRKGNQSKHRSKDEDKKVRVASQNQRTKKAIPVTILSGFLGSGKTTLLKQILTSKTHGLRIAVIVNDMSEVNVDGQTIAAVKKTKKEVVTLENGCICCTLRGDLIREINDIRQTNKFDYVLIESTGVAEPQQVAESFCVDPDTEALAVDQEKMLWNVARLDTCVTVVDTVNFSDYLSSMQRFQDVFQDGLDGSEEADEEGKKSISELMVEQVEFANVILLNKVDLVTKEKILLTKKLIQVLNPKARVMEGSFGKIDLQNILNTNLFNLTEAGQSPGWLSSFQNGINMENGEADEYGVASFVYRSRKPFHPFRIHSFLKRLFCFADDWASCPDQTDLLNERHKNITEHRIGSILRSKGVCWVAGRDDKRGDWAQSGRIVQLNFDSPWYSMVPESEWPDPKSNQDVSSLRNIFDSVCGDRRQEIVFIGTNLAQKEIEVMLDECLLSDQEMKQHSLKLPIGTYPDPFTPMALAFSEAQSVCMIARHGQNQHIHVLPGSCLCLTNLALCIHDEGIEGDISSVKVWLDMSDTVNQGVLLATLRPFRYEQHAMWLKLQTPSQEERSEQEDTIFRRIRVQVVLTKGINKASDELLVACEVHITGMLEPLPYNNADSSDDEGDTASEMNEDGPLTDNCLS